MFEGMYSSWTAPNTSRPPCMEPWRPSLHIPKKNWFDRCITFLKTKIEHVEHHPTLKIGCSFAMAIFRFCFAFHRCRDGEWCCAIQGPNAGLFQSCPWILPLPASEMRKEPSFLVLGRRQALGGKPCGMKVGSTFGQLPYSYLFIPFGSWFFSGQAVILSHSFLAEVYGRLSRDAGSDLAKLTKAGTCSGLTIGFADHWSTDKTYVIFVPELNTKSWPLLAKSISLRWKLSLTTWISCTMNDAGEWIAETRQPSHSIRFLAQYAAQHEDISDIVRWMCLTRPY